MPKEMLIVGGPNGAGKTTFALEYIGQRGSTYLSADAIAAELCPANPSSVELAAGREFLLRIEGLFKGDDDFVIETTLSGRTLAHWAKSAHASGFSISVVYVFLDSADSCVERVRERVKKGGHHVPEHDVRRRFNRSILNFWRIYRPLADCWLLLYNSGNRLQDVALGDSDALSVFDVDLYQRFETLLRMASHG
jgi:predicted ABC-type ATPase